jgi:hypothetical protein
MEDAKKIMDAVREFGTEMRDRMFEKKTAGYTGWDGEGPKAIKELECVQRIKSIMFREPMTARDWIDVANFAMMGWWIKRTMTRGAE